MADYYVVEEMLPLLPKDPYMKTKVSLIKLRSFLLAHLHSGNINSPALESSYLFIIVIIGGGGGAILYQVKSIIIHNNFIIEKNFRVYVVY